jgi:MFS family permease
MTADQVKNESAEPSKWLFWTCFIALIATSFGFIIRTQVIGDWGVVFNLSETQKGEILGVGLWPFALSIILLSFVIDRVGYDKTLWFAFGCHIVSTFVTLFATSYTALYWGTFILALGNGAVEAVINPVVATAYAKEKTKWLNILHAGWPGGMVLGGMLILTIFPTIGHGVNLTQWKWAVALLLIPVAVYGVMLLKAQFPVHERVKAGIPYKEMLQEVGILGAAIIATIMVLGFGGAVGMSTWLSIAIIVILVAVFGFYVRSLGQPLFIFLLLIMLPLATTELGTDSWITELVNPVMAKIGVNGGWVLVYTAFLMMVLRFSAGPIVEKLQPIGLLAVCSVIAIAGLLLLSTTAGIMIFVAATIYGIGKSFFWPTMLGVVAERFPKGGALTMNAIAGMGMLSVGIVGAVWLGSIQDKSMDKMLSTANPALHELVVAEEKASLFGAYSPLDQEKISVLPESDKLIISDVAADAKKKALATVAVFPTIMLVCYLILIFYFRMKGGYKAVDLGIESSAVEDRAKD